MDEVNDNVEEKREFWIRVRNEIRSAKSEQLVCIDPVPRLFSSRYCFDFLLGSDRIGFLGFLNEWLA
jgi:hypothetical protein